MISRDKYVREATQGKSTWSVKNPDGEKEYKAAIKKADKEYDTMLSSYEESGSEDLKKVNELLRKELSEFHEGAENQYKSMRDENERLNTSLKESEKLQNAYDTLKTDSEKTVANHNKVIEESKKLILTNQSLEETHKKAMQEKNETISSLESDIAKLKKK